ncbi:hypothetical protein [Roseibium sediminis]|uniref:hypothetical protein n=1 Tax=Roseibium sediminis TaxID=1775174 RepID=UPI00123CA78F|nr:hypothetical protein [Roseibium sediminis]
MKNKKPILRALVALFALVILALIYLITAFAFFEPQDVTADSWSYKLGIPELLKEIPVYAECEPARYSHNARDGERVGAGMLEYQSSQSLEVLTEKYQQYFLDKSCPVGELQEFRCSGNGYSVLITREEVCTLVDILVLGDFN